MILNPRDPFWRERGNAPFPWIGIALAATAAGAILGVAVTVAVAVFAPDDLLASW